MYHSKILTVDEAAKMLKIHPETVRRLAREGKLPGAYRVGGQWRFDPGCLKPIVE